MKPSVFNVALERPITLVMVIFTLIVAATFGAKNLYFRGDYKVFFEPDNPQRVQFETMEAVFNKNEAVNIIIAPKSKDVFNEQTITLIKELTDAAWQTPMSIRVDSITNFQHTWSIDDDLIVEDLLLELEHINPEKLAQMKAVSIQEPNLVDRLVSRTGEVAVVSITVNMPGDDKTAAVKEISDYSLAMTDEFAARFPEHDFYHTGIVFMNNAFASHAQKDIETLVPLMFLVIVSVLWLLLRSISAVVSTVIIIIATIAATMGLAGWLGFFMSTVTVNVPTLVMTLVVADCVHVIASMTYALSQGKSKKEALAYSIKLNLLPIFITSATTAIGFLTMNFANVPVFADLGNLTAIGVFLAFLFSVTLLPALLMIMPIRVHKHQNESSMGLARLGPWVIRHHKRLLPVSMVVILLSAFFLTKNQVNDIATEYFDPSTGFRQSTDFQQEHISGMSTIDFSIGVTEASGINKPEVLAAIGDFSSWLSQQPEVDHVSTIADTFRRLNKNMHSDDQSYYRLPEQRDLAAQYLLLYEMSLPYGLDLNNQLNIDKSATRITATLQNLGSKEFTQFETRALQWFAQHAPQLQVSSSSPSLMFAHIGEANMASMMRGTSLALLLISALLVFALRSWRMGLISLLPNLVPAIIGFGIWGLYSGQINMALSVVLSMALGIIVDDTVHFLSKYQVAKKEGKTTEESILYAFNTVGRALLITTIVLALGFSVLTFSSFILNADMGKLTAIIIAVALVVDLIVLPVFLLIFDRNPKKESRDDASQSPQLS